MAKTYNNYRYGSGWRTVWQGIEGNGSKGGWTFTRYGGATSNFMKANGIWVEVNGKNISIPFDPKKYKDSLTALNEGQRMAKNTFASQARVNKKETSDTKISDLWDNGTWKGERIYTSTSTRNPITGEIKTITNLKSKRGKARHIDVRKGA